MSVIVLLELSDQILTCCTTLDAVLTLTPLELGVGISHTKHEQKLLAAE